jgi:hypothetical protein
VHDRTVRSLWTIAGATLALGCNTAKLTPMVDSGVDCVDPVPEYPCAPITDGGAGCTGDLGARVLLNRDVVVDASYPPACTLIVNNPVPDDDLHCITEGTCRCVVDGGAYGWQCFN